MSARSEFTKFLKSMDESELRKELSRLYTSIPEVKMHYTMELGGEEQRKKIFDKAKSDVFNLYFIRDKARKRARVAKVKAIIKEMEKVSIFDHELVDFLLYVTRISQDYLARRYSVTKASYNSCHYAFSKALDKIQAGDFRSDFKKECQKIARAETYDTGFDEMMQDAFAAVYQT